MKILQNGVKGILEDTISKLTKVFFSKKKPALTPMWVRTNDLRVHKPKFKIRCRHCDSKMLLRFSELYIIKNVTVVIKRATNVAEYKCPRCSLVQRFFIEDEGEYLQKMLDLRDGVRLFIPPKKEWEAEHDEIKKRLEVLGYM